MQTLSVSKSLKFVVWERVKPKYSINNKKFVLKLEVLSMQTSLNPFPKQNLDSSKMKEFAGDNFKLYENGRKFSE